MNRRTWVVAVLVVAGIVLAVFAVDHGGGDTKSARAILQAKTILNACEAYRTDPSSGQKYPATLKELLEPPWGGPSFLKHSEEDLIDPWGNPFDFAVAEDEYGVERPYVWVERTVDGETKVIGSQPPQQ